LLSIKDSVIKFVFEPNKKTWEDVIVFVLKIFMWHLYLSFVWKAGYKNLNI
jgi:hypothetical protein